MNDLELLRKSEEKNMHLVLLRSNRMAKLLLGERMPSGIIVDELFKKIKDSNFQDLDNRQIARSLLLMWGTMDNSKKRSVNEYDVEPLRT